MTIVYSRPYKVPAWVVLNIQDEKKKKLVVNWLKEAGSRKQEFGTTGYYDYLMSYKSKGWAHALTGTTIVPPVELLERTVVEYSKIVFGPRAQLQPLSSLAGTSRQITSPEVAQNIFDKSLESQDDIGLSQIFDIYVNCGDQDSNQKKVWYSEDKVNVPVLKRVAEIIYTIGESNVFNLNLGDVKKKEDIIQELEDFFTPIAEQLKTKTVKF